jgi:peptidoglycan/xylan/chitin deacetylase (PgdA/CDA1 family)
VAGELVRLQTRQHVVALAFDGGGNAAGIKSVLAALRRERVLATFFLTGHFVRAYVPGAVRRVTRELVPGEIVLMHIGSSRDGSTIDTNALPLVIRAVRARGYRFVTLRGIRAPR